MDLDKVIRLSVNAWLFFIINTKQKIHAYCKNEKEYLIQIIYINKI